MATTAAGLAGAGSMCKARPISQCCLAQPSFVLSSPSGKFSTFRPQRSASGNVRWVTNVRASAQKQKRENTETSKFSSPPSPKPTGPLESSGATEEEAQPSAPADEGVVSSEVESGPQQEKEKEMSQEEIGQALKTLRSERVAQGLDGPSTTQDFWGGVWEETKLVEWPEFRKVLGTTGVVVAIIFGSSILLLTVNAILAELSDNVFNGSSEFAKSWTRGF